MLKMQYQTAEGPVLVLPDVNGNLGLFNMSTGTVFWAVQMYEGVVSGGDEPTYVVTPVGSDFVLFSMYQPTSGLQLAALNLTSGARSYPVSVDNPGSSPVANNGVAYASSADGTQAVAYSIETGFELWTSEYSGFDINDIGVELLGDRLLVINQPDDQSQVFTVLMDLNGQTIATWPYVAIPAAWAPGSPLFFGLAQDSNNDVYLGAFDVKSGNSVWNASDAINNELGEDSFVGLRPASGQCTVLVTTEDGFLLELKSLDGTLIRNYSHIPFGVSSTLADQQGNLLLTGQPQPDSGNQTVALMSTSGEILWSMILNLDDDITAVPAAGGGQMWLMPLTRADNNMDMWLYA